jgi:hypothetical protein
MVFVNFLSVVGAGAGPKASENRGAFFLQKMHFSLTKRTLAIKFLLNLTRMWRII